MCPHVHAGCVEVTKPRLACFVLSFDEILGGGKKLFVDCLHALPGQWSRILDSLPTYTTVLHVLRRIVLVCGPAMQHAPWPESFFEVGIFRIVGILRLFFRIQVVKIAKKLVETMHS